MCVCLFLPQCVSIRLFVIVCARYRLSIGSTTFEAAVNIFAASDCLTADANPCDLAALSWAYLHQEGPDYAVTGGACCGGRLTVWLDWRLADKSAIHRSFRFSPPSLPQYLSLLVCLLTIVCVCAGPLVNAAQVYDKTHECPTAQKPAEMRWVHVPKTGTSFGNSVIHLMCVWTSFDSRSTARASRYSVCQCI